MATFLDIGLVQGFGHYVFPFLLVLVGGMALLRMFGPFKDKPAFAFITATAVAFLSLTSDLFIRTVQVMAPWYVLFIFLIVMLIIGYITFGIDQATIATYLKDTDNGALIGRWIMALTLLIFFGSLGFVISEQEGQLYIPGGPANDTTMTLAEAPQTGFYGFWALAFNPKIMGMVLILLIAFFTVQYMSEV